MCSREYGRDGAAIDIYGGRRNDIHHNVARENLNLVELGDPRTADNTLSYNSVMSSIRTANFVVARGPADRYGPTTGTRMYNNSVYLAGTESYAVQCYGSCDAGIMTFKNNIVWSRDRVGYVDEAWDEGYNIWWSPGGPRLWFEMSSTSEAIDPRFVDPAVSWIRRPATCGCGTAAQP